jgi:hypothetical protein
VANHECHAGSPCCYLKGGDCSHLEARPNANDTIGVLPGRARTARPSATASALVNASGPRRSPMDPRFVSVGCESWEWLFDPGALAHPMLRAVTSLLSPGFLRVGGISSDQIHWVGDDVQQLDLTPGSEENPLNTTTFDRLVEFCRKTNITLIYDLNELWAASEKQQYHRQAGQPWNATATIALLEHARDSDAIFPRGPLYAVELGNELAGGRGWTGNELTIAADYAQLRKHMEQIFGATSKFPMLFGPSACECGQANNSISQFLVAADARGARLDGLTFHSYPLGGGALMERVVQSQQLQSIRAATDCYLHAGRQHSSSLRLAMTETNSNAATGANRGENRFANGLW